MLQGVKGLGGNGSCFPKEFFLKKKIQQEKNGNLEEHSQKTSEILSLLELLKSLLRQFTCPEVQCSYLPEEASLMMHWRGLKTADSTWQPVALCCFSLLGLSCRR